MSDATSNSPHSAAPSATTGRPRVLVSILNWNGSTKTLACLDSMKDELAATPADVTMLVIDNGSRSDDAKTLAEAVASREVVLKCLPKNLGFTGGHNIAIELAIREGYDFIWLLNNDATVAPGTLRALIAEIQGHARCGAVSPVLRDIHDGHIARCINSHDWGKRISTRILDVEEARRFQEQHPEAAWVDGTAVLFRVAALQETGPLDDRLFAYYDDNDIGVRLANKGWSSRCVFDATVFHENREGLEEFPLYLSYLLQRNEMLFLHTHTPPAYRRLLWLKLVDKALFDASRFRDYGFKEHSDAALLGMVDFMRGSFGPPAHQRKVPLVLRMACAIARRVYTIKNAKSRRAARQALALAQQQSM
jgi:GT2 family glycosyltransferase